MATEKYPRGLPVKPPRQRGNIPMATIVQQPLARVANSSRPDLEARLRKYKAMLAAGMVLLLFLLLVVAALAFSQLFRQDHVIVLPSRIGAISPGSPASDSLPVRELTNPLAKANLYYCHLHIGMIADGVRNGVYTEEEGGQVLQIALSLLKDTDRDLEQRLDQAASEERQSILAMQVVSQLLHLQGRELQASWSEDDPDQQAGHEMRYLHARNNAWNGLKELVDLAASR